MMDSMRSLTDQPPWYPARKWIEKYVFSVALTSTVICSGNFPMGLEKRLCSFDSATVLRVEFGMLDQFNSIASK
jgi:hypothetical protein